MSAASFASYVYNKLSVSGSLNTSAISDMSNQSRNTSPNPKLTAVWRSKTLYDEDLTNTSPFKEDGSLLRLLRTKSMPSIMLEKGSPAKYPAAIVMSPANSRMDSSLDHSTSTLASPITSRHLNSRRDFDTTSDFLESSTNTSIASPPPSPRQPSKSHLKLTRSASDGHMLRRRKHQLRDKSHDFPSQGMPSVRCLRLKFDTGQETQSHTSIVTADKKPQEHDIRQAASELPEIMPKKEEELKKGPQGKKLVRHESLRRWEPLHSDYTSAPKEMHLPLNSVKKLLRQFENSSSNEDETFDRSERRSRQLKRTTLRGTSLERKDSQGEKIKAVASGEQTESVSNKPTLERQRSKSVPSWRANRESIINISTSVRQLRMQFERQENSASEIPHKIKPQTQEMQQIHHKIKSQPKEMQQLVTENEKVKEMNIGKKVETENHDQHMETNVTKLIKDSQVRQIPAGDHVLTEDQVTRHSEQMKTPKTPPGQEWTEVNEKIPKSPSVRDLRKQFETASLQSSKKIVKDNVPSFQREIIQGESDSDTDVQLYDSEMPLTKKIPDYREREGRTVSPIPSSASVKNLLRQFEPSSPDRKLEDEVNSLFMLKSRDKADTVIVKGQVPRPASYSPKISTPSENMLSMMSKLETRRESRDEESESEFYDESSMNSFDAEGTSMEFEQGSLPRQTPRRPLLKKDFSRVISSDESSSDDDRMLDQKVLERHQGEQVEREVEEQAKLEKERVEKERKEKEEEEQERMLWEKARQEQLIIEKAKLEQIALQKADEERVALEKAVLEKQEKEKAEQERITLEKAEMEKIAREKAEQNRQALEKAEMERIAREKAEQDRQALEKAEMERKTKDKAEQQRIALEKAEMEKLVMEKLEQEQIALEKAKLEKMEREKAELELLALEKEKLEEQKAKEKAEKEEQNRIAIEEELWDKEKALKERADRERETEELQREQKVGKLVDKFTTIHAGETNSRERSDSVKSDEIRTGIKESEFKVGQLIEKFINKKDQDKTMIHPDPPMNRFDEGRRDSDVALLIDKFANVKRRNSSCSSNSSEAESGDTSKKSQKGDPIPKVSTKAIPGKVRHLNADELRFFNQGGGGATGPFVRSQSLRLNKNEPTPFLRRGGSLMVKNSEPHPMARKQGGQAIPKSCRQLRPDELRFFAMTNNNIYDAKKKHKSPDAKQDFRLSSQGDREKGKANGTPGEDQSDFRTYDSDSDSDSSLLRGYDNDQGEESSDEALLLPEDDPRLNIISYGEGTDDEDDEAHFSSLTNIDSEIKDNTNETFEKDTQLRQPFALTTENLLKLEHDPGYDDSKDEIMQDGDNIMHNRNDNAGHLIENIIIDPLKLGMVDDELQFSKELHTEEPNIFFLQPTSTPIISDIIEKQNIYQHGSEKENLSTQMDTEAEVDYNSEQESSDDEQETDSDIGLMEQAMLDTDEDIMHGQETLPLTQNQNQIHSELDPEFILSLINLENDDGPATTAQESLHSVLEIASDMVSPLNQEDFNDIQITRTRTETESTSVTSLEDYYLEIDESKQYLSEKEFAVFCILVAGLSIVMYFLYNHFL